MTTSDATRVLVLREALAALDRVALDLVEPFESADVEVAAASVRTELDRTRYVCVGFIEAIEQQLTRRRARPEGTK